MGSVSSKTARRYPKPSRVPITEANQLAESHRTKGLTSTSYHGQFSSVFLVEIKQDAGDPDFLANLSRLGPVRVNHSMETTRLVGCAFL